MRDSIGKGVRKSGKGQPSDGETGIEKEIAAGEGRGRVVCWFHDLITSLVLSNCSGIQEELNGMEK
jgi:hypothetical protein